MKVELILNKYIFVGGISSSFFFLIPGHKCYLIIMLTWLMIEEKSQQLANDCAKIKPERLTLKSSVANGAVKITRAFWNNNFGNF